MASVYEFYEAGFGDRFMDAHYYTPLLKQYREEERQIVDAFAESIDLLFEVGCMNGLYLDWAVQHGKRYVGLDFIVRHVQQGRARIAEYQLADDLCQFIHGDASSIIASFDPGNFSVEPERCLILFPFNSLGNMEGVGPIIKTLGTKQLPFLFSSYQTTPYVTEIRRTYYENCGYTGLTAHYTHEGACVTSNEGLRSIAYYEEYFQRICHDYAWPVNTISFASIGMAYCTDTCVPTQLLQDFDIGVPLQLKERTHSVG